MDTLDQIPPELTRVHSDLNELGAVLYCKWTSLTTLSSRAKTDLDRSTSYPCQPREETLYADQLDTRSQCHTREALRAPAGDCRGGGEIQAWG